MPIPLTFEDYNTNGYTEHINNQYRRVYPDSADVIYNIKPGLLCASEQGMLTIANTEQQQWHNFPITTQETLLSRLQSFNNTWSNSLNVVATYAHNDIIYSLLIQRQSLPNTGIVLQPISGNVFNVALISYDLNSEIWDVCYADTFTIDTTIDTIITGNIDYYGINDSLILSCKSYLGEYRLNQPQLPYKAIREVNATVTITNISGASTIDLNKQINVSNYQGTVDTSNNGNLYISNAGYFKGISDTGIIPIQSQLLDDNGDPITQTRVISEIDPDDPTQVTTNTFEEDIMYTSDYLINTDLVNISTDTTFLLQPIRKLIYDGDLIMSPKQYVLYVWLPELDQDDMYNYLQSNWTSITNLQWYQRASVWLYNNLNGKMYTFYNTGPTSFKFFIYDNGMERPYYEVLMSSQTERLSIPNFYNHQSFNVDTNLNVSNRQLIISAPNYVQNQDTSLPSVNYNQQQFTFNLFGNIPQSNTTTQSNNTTSTYNFIRIFRTVQAPNSSGAQYHHVTDLPIKPDGTFEYRQYNAENNQQLNGYLSYFNYQSIITSHLGNYNHWSYSYLSPDYVTVSDEYLIMAKDNKIYLTQPYQNGSIGESLFVDENRSIQRLTDNVLNIKSQNGKLYVLTSTGLSTLDNVNVTISLLNDGNYTYRGFVDNIISNWSSSFTNGTQMYIASDSTFYAINDFGELLQEDGNLNMNWGYKSRYVSPNRLSWTSCLDKWIVTDSKSNVSLLDQVFTIYIYDELYQGFYSYARNLVNDNYVVPLNLSNQHRSFNLITYKNLYYLVYYNSTGLNIVELFNGDVDNLIVEQDYVPIDWMT